MKKTRNLFAFTLIELLVVITIIGILATGAVSVFTTQLQGARDSTRIGDMKVIEWALHQLFSDDGEYPAMTSSGQFQTAIKPFVSKSLKDPKAGKGVCWDTDSSNAKLCHWYYNSFPDSFNLPYAAFKLWVHFEKKKNYIQKAKTTGTNTDGWVIDNMYEIFAWAWAETHSWTTFNANIMY